MAIIVMEVPEKVKDLEDLLQLCRDFGAEDSCLLSRSIHQLVLMPNDFDICGTLPLQDIVREAIDQSDISPLMEPYCSGESEGREEDVSGRELVPMKDVLLDYLNYLTRAFGSLLQCYGHNLARQRDKLLRQCLEEFGVLHADAEKIEMEIEARARNSQDSKQQPQQQVRPVLSNFLLFHLLQLMYYHFDLGFRLELFVPYEFVFHFYSHIFPNRLMFIA